MEIFREEGVVLFKIVYYGPALCGKTTNLHQIFKRLKPEQKLSPAIIEIPTQTDKTLTFDFMPLAVGSIGSYTVKLQVYTVPGQIHYQASRKLILQGADGVVFVADSQRSMCEQNQITLSEMNIYLKGLNLQHIPLVLQFNKQDLPDAMSAEEMARNLQNEKEAPAFEASAMTGFGVMETLDMIARMAKASIKKSSKKSNEN